MRWSGNTQTSQPAAVIVSPPTLGSVTDRISPSRSTMAGYNGKHIRRRICMRVYVEAPTYGSCFRNCLCIRTDCKRQNLRKFKLLLLPLNASFLTSELIVRFLDHGNHIYSSAHVFYACILTVFCVYVLLSFPYV